MYTVAVSKKLTKADIDAFVETNPTATVTFVAKTADMCSNPTVTTVSWEACGSCKISKEAYEITLPDDECGGSAKAELQAAFPYLTIEDYGTPGGCQHKFKTTVVTNMVCDECDDIFKDFFVSKAPESYRGRNWKRLGAVAGDSTIIADPLPKNCKCGILFRGIDYMISPSDCLIDRLTFQEGSVRIAVMVVIRMNNVRLSARTSTRSTQNTNSTGLRALTLELNCLIRNANNVCSSTSVRLIKNLWNVCLPTKKPA